MKKIGGRYYGYWTNKNRDPKEKSYPLGTSLKSAAKLKFNEMQRREADPNDPVDPWVPGSDVTPEYQHVTFTDAKARFLGAKSYLKPNTTTAYEGVLRRLGETLPPNLMLRDLTPDRLKSFVHEKYRRKRKKEDPPKKLSRASQRRRYTHLRAFFKWCVEEARLLKENPLDQVPEPKPERKLPEYLTKDELERLITAIRTDFEMKKADFRAQDGQILWLVDAIMLAVSTGMRRGELLNLEWFDVDFKQGTIRVRHSEGFSTKGNSERQIPMVKPARETLEKLAMDRKGDLTGPVLRGATGEALYPNQFTRRFKHYVREAKLDERFSVHSLRHTTASWLLQNGVSLEVVGAILGHTDTRTTKIYAHLAQDTLTEAMRSTFDGV